MARNDGMVYLSNDFIRLCKFSFTMQQWRIFLRLVSLVNKYDEPNTVYAMRIDELAHSIGLNTDNCRMTLCKIREQIQNIRDQSFYYGSLQDSKLLDTIQAVEFKKGVLSFKFCDHMREFVFDQKSSFIAFDSTVANAIDSPFILKLYMLMKSYASIGMFKASPNTLIEILYDRKTRKESKKMALKNKEKSTSELRRRLRDAVKIINDVTDIDIEIPVLNRLYEHCNNIIEFKIKSSKERHSHDYVESVSRSFGQRKNRFKINQLANKLVLAVEQNPNDIDTEEIEAAANDTDDTHILTILYNHDKFRTLDEKTRRIAATNDLRRLERVYNIVADWT